MWRTMWKIQFTTTGVHEDPLKRWSLLQENAHSWFNGKSWVQSKGISGTVCSCRQTFYFYIDCSLIGGWASSHLLFLFPLTTTPTIRYKMFLTPHLYSYLHRTFQFTCSKEITEKWANIKGCPLNRTASELLWVHSLSGANGSSKLQCKNQGRVNIKDEAFISGRFERSGRESDGKEIGHKICELLNTQADGDHGGVYPSLRADLQRLVADSDQVRQSKTLWTP